MTKISRFLAAMVSVVSAMFAAVMSLAMPSLAPPDTPAVPRPGTTMPSLTSLMIANMASPAGSPGVGPFARKVTTIQSYFFMDGTNLGATNDNGLLGGAIAA